MPGNPYEIRQRDSVYRRGVLLGMTMAEIMILILFCLLMAFILKLETYEKEVEQTETAQALMDTLERIAGNYDDAWELLSSLEKVITTIGVDALGEVAELLEQRPDMTRDDILSAVGQGLSHYQNVQDALSASTEQRPTPEEVAESIVARMTAGEHAIERAPETEALDALRSQVEDETGHSPSPEELRESVRELLADSKAWRSTEQGSIEAEYENSLLENQDLKERMGRLDKALVKATGQLQGRGQGQGLVYPSCFETPEGKTQFIFNVVFDESSMQLTALPVPGNEERWARLNFDRITTGDAIPVKRYLDETLAVFTWSEENACRFFVKIEDHTLAENKSQYKVIKRFIERRFYTYESLQPVLADGQKRVNVL